MAKRKTSRADSRGYKIQPGQIGILLGPYVLGHARFPQLVSVEKPPSYRLDGEMIVRTQSGSGWFRAVPFYDERAGIPDAYVYTPLEYPEEFGG